jgi:quercetin dioxygenase-like cupin family protein
MRTLLLLLAIGCGGTQTPPSPPPPAAREPSAEPAPPSTTGDPATRRNATIIDAGAPGPLWSDDTGDGKLVAVPLHARPNQGPGRNVIALTASGVCSATAPCTVYDHTLPADPQRATYQTWEAYGPDRRIARLWGNLETGPAGVKVEVKAGAAPFWHMHRHDVRMVVLAGSVEYLESGQPTRTLTPGAYVLQPRGYKHSESCKAGADCVLYIHSARGFDVKPL